MTTHTSLQGEHLEVQFYYAKLSEREAMLNLHQALIGMGALLHKSLIFRGKLPVFTSGYDLALLEGPHAIDLETLLADSNANIVESWFHGAIGIVRPEQLERVMFAPISKEAAITDKHPLCILSECSSFSLGALSEIDHNKAMSNGLIVYERFTELVRRTKPSYAVITCEEPLLCPHDLWQAASESRAFYNFYISESLIGRGNMRSLSSMFSNCYSETLVDGYYFASSKYFNPKRKQTEDPDHEARSAHVARIIGDTIQMPPKPSQPTSHI